MFETQSKDEIQKRMAADLSAMHPNSTIEGSFGRDVINATSVEFEKTYAELSLVNQAGFAQTSWGDYLENIAEEHGVFRRAAVQAIGTVTVTGTSTSNFLSISASSNFQPAGSVTAPTVVFV